LCPEPRQEGVAQKIMQTKLTSAAYKRAGEYTLYGGSEAVSNVVAVTSVGSSKIYVVKPNTPLKAKRIEPASSNNN
jgi:hypothetical protein